MSAQPFTRAEISPAAFLADAIRELVGAAEPRHRTGIEVRWPAGSRQPDSDLLDAIPSEVPFTTSGTTGTPVVWWRARHQLLMEGKLLIDLMDLNPVDVVYSYAPTRHLYGFLLGCIVPALLGVPVHFVGLEEPLPDFDAKHPLLAMLPASWWHLARSLRMLDGACWLTAVHSSAHLPSAADELGASLGRYLRLHELLGSTETGGVAHRMRQTSDPLWRLMPDVSYAVEARPGMEQKLAVRSPRLARRSDDTARPQEFVLDDVILGGPEPRTFRLLGRENRLVKVNGRRVNLTNIESRLREAVPDTELRCVAVRDRLRGEWYEIHVVGGPEPRRHVADVCGELLAVGETPREIRVVDRIDEIAEERKLLP